MRQLADHVVTTFRPRWVMGRHERLCGYLSGVVALSSVGIGCLLIVKLTTFPPVLYMRVPEQICGAVFAAVGLTHSVALIRWWAGRASDWLSRLNLAEVFISLCFGGFSIASAVTEDTGYLVTVFIAGGVVLTLLVAFAGVWEQAAPKLTATR